MNEAAIPAYPHRHAGPCLVCGNAWTLADDVARARRLRPNALVIAVNKAAGELAADFLFSIHFEKLPRWIPLQAARFGIGFSIHGVGSREAKKQAQREREAPYVDYWWPDARGAGSSTWSAAKVARLMGFDEIILCGMPLAAGPYADGKLANDFMRAKITDHYRAAVAGDIAWHAGVSAMSGWTREFFGEPT
jgi:hypothetical protein